MSAFEDFVSVELPKRTTMLTLGNTGFDGNPNSGGPPVVVSNAPQGTFFFQTTGNALWKKNTSSPGSWELVGSGVGGGGGITPVARLTAYSAPAMANVTAIHASASTFSTPANPDIPRNLTVTFASDWDGGNVTVNGANQFSQASSEVFSSSPGSTVTGVKVFASVSSVSRASAGSGAASVGTGNSLGVGGLLDDAISAVLFVDNIPEFATLDATNHSFTPETPPDGSVSFSLLANVTG